MSAVGEVMELTGADSIEVRQLGSLFYSDPYNDNEILEGIVEKRDFDPNKKVLLLRFGEKEEVVITNEDFEDMESLCFAYLCGTACRCKIYFSTKG